MKREDKFLNGFNTVELNNLIESLERNPESGNVSYKCRTHWQSGAKAHHHFSQYRVDGMPQRKDDRRFTIQSDEPAIFGVTDTAPGPAELLLGALGGCVTATINTYAALNDIELVGLQVDVTGEMNLHGMFDLAENIPIGFKTIKVRICISGNTSESRLRELAMNGFSHSPIRNSLKGAIALEVGISAEGIESPAFGQPTLTRAHPSGIADKPHNKTAIAFMRSVGYRAGIFDAMRRLNMASAEKIAREASLHERYVKEWLGAMVTGGVVEYIPDSRLYRLNDQSATEAASNTFPDKNDPYAQILTDLEFEIIKCFRDGSELPEERFSSFYALLSEESLGSDAYKLQENVFPLVDDLQDRLLLGINVLEVGCGSGKTLIKLAGHYPNSHFTGVDSSPEVISLAIEEARTAGLNNIDFDIKDLHYYHMTSPVEQFDLVFSFNGYYAQSLNVVKGVNLALKDNGIALMQDIAGTGYLEQDKNHPYGPFLYMVSFLQSMTVAPSQEHEGLGARWGEKLTRENFRKAGFTHVETKVLDQDLINNWYVVKRSPVYVY
jgi:SAM-dependent methyltransferase/uncharacterized OsmC-like protein